MSALFAQDRMPERAADGCFCHPDFEQFFEGEEGPLNRDRLFDAGFFACMYFLADDETDDAFRVNKAYEEGDLNLSSWDPQIGDSWLRVGIWDTEDGPIAFFVRPVR